MEENCYRKTFRVGDVVETPDGIAGTVDRWDIICGGNVMQMHVRPSTNWLHRLYLALTGQTWFYDEQIDRLKLIRQAPQS